MSLKSRLRPYAEPARLVMAMIGISLLKSDYSEVEVSTLIGGAMAAGSAFWMVYDMAFPPADES